MKKFLIKSTLFLLLPALAILIAGVLLPPTIFTFRTYEALSFGTEIPRNGFFYPHQKTFMYAEGDLCHHTSKSILKKELWITDKFGFRNDEFIEKADILLIGDSFFAGTGSSQDEIISNKINSNSN